MYSNATKYLFYNFHFTDKEMEVLDSVAGGVTKRVEGTGAPWWSEKSLNGQLGEFPLRLLSWVPLGKSPLLSCLPFSGC